MYNDSLLILIIAVSIYIIIVLPLTACVCYPSMHYRYFVLYRVQMTWVYFWPCYYFKSVQLCILFLVTERLY